jgi:glycosyltransferase involved in cell wall biosynthesis
VKLGFDATSLTARGKGLARFQAEFLRVCERSLTVFVPEDADESALPDRFQYVRVDTKPMLFWEQVRRPRLARGLGLDVVLHLSERASLFGPPQVVYIYEHPKHRARRNREVGAPLRQRAVDGITLALATLGLRRAAIVLSASESTRRDVGRGYVVYPGVSPAFTPGTGPRTSFLHLASDDPRDNSAVVVDAYRRLREPRPPLVIGGDAPSELRSRAAGLEVEWAGFRTGDALVELYRGAIAYVDPSLYEGFGLQAAEALACGAPVVCSNVTSLPEVVGEAGILLDPHDVDGFARAMQRLADEPELGGELARRAPTFSWERTVRETLAACERAALARASAAAAT